MFYFCAQCTFFTYRLKSVLFLYTVNITVESVLFLSQYTFRMYRVEFVLFLCTTHIFDVTTGKCSVRINISDVPSEELSVSVHSTYF